MPPIAGSSNILVVNTGSSSLKLGLYEPIADEERLVLDGLADGIGQSAGTLTLLDAAGNVLRSAPSHHITQADALAQISGWMRDLDPAPPAAIGHRVVHGGPKLTEHQRITPEVLAELGNCVHLAPLHIPMALDLIQATESTFPGVPQCACFDTAFHRTLPEVASHLPLPSDLFHAGIRRYGFHGLSYESIVHQLAADLPSRAVFAHLGGGASLAAVKDGRSVDTSMGLTPTGGIPMGTRSGDLDPGVLLYLLRSGRFPDADALEQLVNHDAGLHALSGQTPDMRQLLSSAHAGDTAAALAVDIFCMGIAKYVAAYTAVLGGIDLLVFSGGIGEHASPVRQAVCDRLSFLGIHLDAAGNDRGASTISAADSPVRVRVLPSQEDLQIARHSRSLLRII